MNPRVLSLIIASALTLLSTRSLAAQCRTAADTAGLLVAQVRLIYTNVDTAFVKSQGDPVADPSEISLVTDPNTCQAAVDAYNQSHAHSNAPHIASAYVIALGGSGYFVINPDETVGEFTSLFLYDRNWVLKRELAG